MKKSLLVCGIILLLAGCGSPDYARSKDFNRGDAIKINEDGWMEYKWSGKACYLITYASNGHYTIPQSAQKLENVKSGSDCKE